MTQTPQDSKGYDPSKFLHVEDINLTEETKQLLEQAEAIYKDNFDGKTWYGRCIFISWYCSLADCTFCFRSTNKHIETHPEGSRRSMGTILLEALFAKLFNWKIEFLTGGIGIMPFSDLLNIIKCVREVYGQKIWLNLGILTPTQIEQVKPYVEGIYASMETLTPELHKEVCPSKPIEPYSMMFNKIEGLRKAIAVIVGLGDKIEDIEYLFDFVEKHDIDRVTMYALKPVRGTPYTKGPEPDEYFQWLARLRIKFPKIEIVAGTNLRRSEECGYLMRTGANAVTKFPATKQFGTKKAKLIESMIKERKRDFISNITTLPDIDWDKEIKQLEIPKEYKTEMKEKLPLYLDTFKKPLDKDKSMK